MKKITEVGYKKLVRHLVMNCQMDIDDAENWVDDRYLRMTTDEEVEMETERRIKAEHELKRRGYTV
jgi:hypothetical protein